MAEENDILIKIDSNLDEYQKEAVETAKKIKDLRDEIKRLSQAEGDNSEEIEANKAELRAAQKDYREATKSVDNLTKANKAQAGSYEQLQAQLRIAEKNLKSQAGLLTKNADGTIQLSDSYMEASKELENARNAVNEFNLGIHNGSTNVGLYQESIENALGGIKVFGVDAGAAFKSVEGGLGGMVKAGISQLKTLAAAFLSNPIGIIIVAIVAAVAALSKAFKRSEESMNKLKVVTGALSGIFSGLMKALEPVVEFIADSVIVIFEKLGQIATKVIGWVSKGLKALGFDKAAASVDNFNKRMEESAKAGAELARMEAELQKAQRQSQKIQLDYQRQAEKLRQIRDDEANDIEDRIKINEKLGAVLKKQLNDELGIANQALQLAQRRIELEGESTSNLDALAEAETRVSDIMERISGQESEQLMNLNSLRRERAAYYKEQSDNLSKLMDEEMRRVQAEQDAEAMVLEIKEQLRREARDKRREAEAIDAENEMQVAIQRGLSEFEVRQAQLEAQRKLEVAEARKLGADIQLINEKYSGLQIQLEQQTQDAKLAIYAGFAGQIANLLGQQTVAGKIAAIAQTAINTYLGAQAAFAQTPGGIGIKSAAAALAVATGLANIRKILAVDTSGKSTPSVSAGGSGAFVATRANTAAAQSQLILPTIAQNIGTTGAQTTANQTAQSINGNQAIVDAISQLKVVATIEDIDREQKNKIKIEENATF